MDVYILRSHSFVETKDDLPEGVFSSLDKAIEAARPLIRERADGPVGDIDFAEQIAETRWRWRHPEDTTGEWFTWWTIDRMALDQVI